MSQRKRILVFNREFLPGFKGGGIIKSLANLVSRLGDYFDFRVVTRDRDLGDTSRYAGVTVEEWRRVEGCDVCYLENGRISLRRISGIVEETVPDLIYLNSFFDSVFTQRVLLLRWFGRLKDVSLCLAPRGEFSKGAIVQKRFKKRVFIVLARVFGLYKGIHWHASSEFEAEDICRELPWVKRGDISVALDLAPVRKAKPERAPREAGRENELVLAFLSRIVPKKNLLFALEALALVKVPVRFLVFGTREDDTYWRLCADRIERLPSNVRVEYRGFVLPDDVPARLSEADLFFFPTLGENYGHVIHEALCAGLPVVLSDQTPWHGVLTRDVGWIYPLSDAAPYALAIEAYWGMSEEARAAMAERALAYGDEVARGSAAVHDHIRMFERLTGEAGSIDEARA